MAIYEAGKADWSFQSRAPSTAALEKMLLPMSEPTAAAPCHSLQHHRDAPADHRYDDDDEEERPVKVKVECPPRADTVFSFRVQSN